MPRGWKVVVLLAALGECRAATAREPITLGGHRGGVYCVSFAPDGKALASGSGDHTVKLWQLSSEVTRARQERIRRLLAELDDDRFGVREKASLELAKLGREIEPELQRALNDAATLEVRARLRRLLAALRAPVEEQHHAEVRCIAFSPHGDLVASGSKDKNIVLWHAHTSRALATIDGQSGTIWSLAFAPDGSTLASGGMDNSVKLWDVATRRLHATFNGHAGPVHSLAFSSDGRTLASAGSFDGTVRLWDVANREPKAVLEGSGGAVLCVAFSPDGRTVAAAGYDGAILLFDVESDKPTPPEGFQGHSSTVRSLAFSPDGKTLASASEDYLAKLWEVGSGRLLAALKGHTAAVNSVMFSPDGRTVATASLDGTVKLWDVSPRPATAAVGRSP